MNKRRALIWLAAATLGAVYGAVVGFFVPSMPTFVVVVLACIACLLTILVLTTGET